MLYSQRFYKRHFGKYAEVLWLPDTFGFNQTIPQIAKQSKIKAFLTHKVFWNDTNKFPYNVFRWVGPDGDWITAVAYGNGRGGYNGDFTVSSVLEQWRNWADKDQPMLYSYGYGDGGGGPNVEMLLRAEAINDLPILPKVDLTSGLNGYLNSVKPTNEWRGELYLETHRGTLSSHSRVKLLNRLVEVALREGELWCGLAGVYDRSRFTGLWLTLLRDQFHDVLPGSAVRVVYEGVYRELEGVYREAMGLAEGCARLIAGEGNELLVFNSLPWDRFGYVKVSEPLPNTQGMGDGYLALVKAPSVGYSVLKPLSPVEPVRLVEDGGGFVLENSRVSARVNLDGTVASVVDKPVAVGCLGVWVTLSLPMRCTWLV
jgi:Alpha-mannosidase